MSTESTAGSPRAVSTTVRASTVQFAAIAAVHIVGGAAGVAGLGVPAARSGDRGPELAQVQALIEAIDQRGDGPHFSKQ